MRYLWVLLIFGVCTLGIEAKAGHFVDHLNGAIRINTSRKPLYSALTEKESEKISNTLVTLERFSLFTARGLERRLQTYEEQGIPYFTNALVSMDEVPEFAERAPAPFPSLEDFFAPDLKSLASRLGERLRVLELKELEEEIELELETLSEPKAFHCMLRHVLESLKRGSQAARHAFLLAETQGVDGKALRSNILSYLQSHLLVLSSSHELDRMAAPLQAKGVPIICNDVPPIGDFRP